jgi:hypothetical protein
MSESSSRRSFLQATTAAAAGAAIPAGALPQPSRAAVGSSFLSIVSHPDRVFAQVEGEGLALERIASGEWVRGGVRVETAAFEDRLAVRVASDVPLRRVELRWARRAPAGLRVLGDHWERGYGDLEWRGVVPERPMPWYFLTHDGRSTHGYGVRTGGGALAHWHLDSEGVSLWLDLPCSRAGRSKPPASSPARGRATSRPSLPHGPSAPCFTSGRSCRRRPSTAATAGTAPTTASTPTSSDR